MALQPILFGGASLGPDLSKMQSSYENARKNALAEQTARAQTEQQNQLKAILSSGNPFSPEVYSRVAPFDPEMAGKLAAEGRAQGVETRAQSKFDTEARQTVLQEGQKKMAGLIANLVISGGSDEALMALEDAATTPEQRAVIEQYWKMPPDVRKADALSKPGVLDIVKAQMPKLQTLGSAQTGMGYVDTNPASPTFNEGVPRAIGNAPQAAGQRPTMGGKAPQAPEAIAGLLSAAEAKYGLPAGLLVRVAKQESNFNPNAVSPKGAQGLMQLMPDTARGLGVDPNDVAQNIEGGAKYLRQMLDRFNGDVRLALAAYNAGPGRVEQYGGVPPFRETQNYVQRILNSEAPQSSPMFSAPKAPPPPKPVAQWVDATVNGVPGQRNSATGQFNPLPEYAVKAGAGTAQTPAAREAEIANSAAKVSTVKDMMATIERAKGLAGFGETGFVGSLTREVGGTKSLALKNVVDTLQANLSFDNLKKMREESKTGGALGSITVRELELLASTVASLDPNMEQSEFLKSLKTIEQKYARVISAANKDAFPNAPPIGGVVKNHTYNGGDPRDQANWTKVR